MVINTNKSLDSECFKELQLLQSWFSPSFPIGSYGYSHGLESLIEEKIIQNKSDVIDYLVGIIFNGSCKNDVIFIKYTYQGLELNDYIMALCASKERKIEILALGNAFAKILKDSWKFEISDNVAYPIAVAKAGINFNISLQNLSLFYIQSFISNLINICVKHIPLGQKVGQDCIIETLPKIEKLIKDMKHFSIDDIGGINFVSDIHSMKHENLRTRIYLS
jgi:urease accessory protein|tara:strand:- start:1922 stop:2584 length:663 start_codon:yes stop_codon:yes gene_type:complete